MLNPRSSSQKLAMPWVKRNSPVIRISSGGIETAKISPTALLSRGKNLCRVTYLCCQFSSWWMHADKAANGWFPKTLPHWSGFQASSWLPLIKYIALIMRPDDCGPNELPCFIQTRCSFQCHRHSLINCSEDKVKTFYFWPVLASKVLFSNSSISGYSHSSDYSKQTKRLIRDSTFSPVAFVIRWIVSALNHNEVGLPFCWQCL